MLKPTLTDWLRSLDGLHPSDLTQWISMAPNGSIAQLYGQGTYYSNYYTSQAPADSFPGVIAPTTGARMPCSLQSIMGASPCTRFLPAPCCFSGQLMV